MAVVALLAIMTSVSILFLAALSLVSDQNKRGAFHANQEKALYYAEAGIQKYLFDLNRVYRYYEVQEVDKSVYEARLDVETAFHNGFYYLEVTPPDISHPYVTITSTGWAGNDYKNKCTVRAEARKKQFSQFIYVSDEEETTGGSEVWWITGDQIWGPLHTNGTLHIDGGPIFHGPVTYSVGIEQGSPYNPTFPTGYPKKTAQMTFPDSNEQVKDWAKKGGYYYNGRTCILLQGDQEDPLKQVKVRYWKDGVEYVEEKELPSNGVIYVDGSQGDDKWGKGMGNAFVSGTLKGRLTIAACNDIYITGKDPTNYNYDSATDTGGVKYSDANLSSSPVSDDMLGLIAGRFVRILHYDWPNNSSPYYRTSKGNVSPYNITIHAAIFALEKAYEFEKHNESPLNGTVTLAGSVTQKYRGAVGTFNDSGRVTGYIKNYTHDPRMAYDTPPHFLAPLNSGWEISSWRRVTTPSALAEVGMP
jgi:hypothetical protein